MKLNNFFKSNKDSRGDLQSAEITKFKLFKIKRFFLINFKNKQKRGNHAHYQCSQYFICIKGKIKIEITNKKGKKNYVLSEKSKKGILVKKRSWNIIKSLVKKTQVLCFCDKTYSKKDYITNYKKFKNLIQI